MQFKNIFKKREKGDNITYIPLTKAKVFVKKDTLYVQLYNLIVYKKNNETQGIECNIISIPINKKKSIEVEVQIIDEGVEMVQKTLVGVIIYLMLDPFNNQKYKQLNLAEAGLRATQKPLVEDEGKILFNLLSKNIKARKGKKSHVELLTKSLVIVFAVSLLFFGIIQLVNLYYIGHFVTVAGSLNSAIHHLIALNPASNTIVP